MKDMSMLNLSCTKFNFSDALQLDAMHEVVFIPDSPETG
jgi:hypothetical protein